MQIVIDGCDGVGKSSLASALANTNGLGYLHFTSDDKQNFNFYHQVLDKKKYVYDRGPISDLVYPHVFNRQKGLTYNEVKRLIINKHNVLFIILYDTKENITKRLKDDEYEKIRDNVDYINCKYKTIGFELSGYQNVKCINIYGLSQIDVFLKVDKIIGNYYE